MTSYKSPNLRGYIPSFDPHDYVVSDQKSSTFLDLHQDADKYVAVKKEDLENLENLEGFAASSLLAASYIAQANDPFSFLYSFCYNEFLDYCEAFGGFLILLFWGVVMIWLFFFVP